MGVVGVMVHALVVRASGPRSASAGGHLSSPSPPAAASWCSCGTPACSLLEGCCCVPAAHLLAPSAALRGPLSGPGDSCSWRELLGPRRSPRRWPVGESARAEQDPGLADAGPGSQRWAAFAAVTASARLGTQQDVFLLILLIVLGQVVDEILVGGRRVRARLRRSRLGALVWLWGAGRGVLLLQGLDELRVSGVQDGREEGLQALDTLLLALVRRDLDGAVLGVADRRVLRLDAQAVVEVVDQQRVVEAGVLH